mmetsp:Transcript_24919/g.57880  ORF Transcript_24919/g.57880 Transcript_24919/m.57880 type:complete len:251 (-) Transcript_24919:52-804(-)
MPRAIARSLALIATGVAVWQQYGQSWLLTGWQGRGGAAVHRNTEPHVLRRRPQPKMMAPSRGTGAAASRVAMRAKPSPKSRPGQRAPAAVVPAGGTDEILHGDSIWLRAHTGMYIGDLDDPNDFDYPIWVKARGRRKDQRNQLRIEKEEDMKVPVESGDVVRLVIMKTGVHIDCLGSAVRARYYDEKGKWQRIAIVKQEGGVIRSGDRVFLRGWQGEYIDAEPGTEDGEIKCRWRDEAEWQAFTIDKYPD